MASGLNDSWKVSALATLLANTVKVILVDTADDTNSLTADDGLSDIAAGGIVATATLGSKTTALGVFDSADVTWTSVTGDSVEECDMYDDTVVGDLLVGKWEFTSVSPNGGNIVGTVNASGWFSL